MGVLQIDAGLDDGYGQFRLRGAVASGLIDRLVARGAVERQPDRNDRRRHILKVTKNGKALLKEARGLVHDAEKAALGRLSTAQQKTLLNSLRTAVETTDELRAQR